MLKRLFYSSAIILMLALAYHLGARNSEAQPGSTFRVVGDVGPFVLSGGTIYLMYGPANPWHSIPDADYTLPPVPVSDLLLYTGWSALTFSGEGWFRQGNTWISLGLVPGGTVTVQPETWGGVKQKFRK